MTDSTGPPSTCSSPSPPSPRPSPGLEKELGVPLFHRIGRRAVLSEAGKELVGPARLVMRDLDAAQSAVQALRGVRSGRLDIITMPSPGIEPLTSMIAGFTRLHPSVRLNVSAAFTPEEVIESVRSGSTEIGLAGSPTPIRVPGVEVLELERQPLILIVNPQADTFSPGTAIQREDLGGHRLIASQRGSLMRWLVDDALAHGVETRKSSSRSRTGPRSCPWCWPASGTR